MAVYNNDPNLVALLPLDELSGTRLDYTSNNNDLTDNNTVIGDAADKMEGAASAVFVRANAETLSITDAAQTGLDLTPPFSIVFWLKLDQIGETRGILGKWATNDNSYYIYRPAGTAPDSHIRVRLSTNGTSYASFTNDTDVDANWHHIGIVANNTDVRIYLDGALDTASPGAWTEALHNSDAIFQLGDRFDGQYLDGHLDKVGIFSRALSAAEVLSIKTVGIQDFRIFINNNKRHNTLLRM